MPIRIASSSRGRGPPAPRDLTNWINTPTLLLDATADIEVTKILHHGREVVEHHAPLDLNLRVDMVADRS